MAGKAARTKKRLEKMKTRRALKRALHEYYQKLAGTERNRKLRDRQMRARTTLNPINHVDGPCGNIGCRKCHPETAWPFGRRHRRSVV